MESYTLDFAMAVLYFLLFSGSKIWTVNAFSWERVMEVYDDEIRIAWNKDNWVERLMNAAFGDLTFAKIFLLSECQNFVAVSLNRGISLRLCSVLKKEMIKKIYFVVNFRRNPYFCKT